MKKLIILTLFSSALWASEVPHLEMDMDSHEYEKLLENASVLDSNLGPVLETGKKLLDWVRFINKDRPESKQISLSSKNTQSGIPISSPSYNSESLALKDYQGLKTTLPNFMKEVLFQNKPFPAKLPVSDAEFIDNGRLVDRAYQRAARWTLQEPYLFQYSARKSNDIRGYFFLQKTEDLDSKWQQWNQVDNKEKTNIREWLINLCANTDRETTCKGKVSAAGQDGSRLKAIYDTYLPKSKVKYDSFFKIQNARRDITWRVNSKMEVPFIRPSSTEVENFLTSNIEEEWQIKSLPWQLKLNFVASGSHANVKFVPGATPSVKNLGGNTITMDANTPITEYNVQWTIRHEFGHVLGFPDCYIEFYDDTNRVMVNYQIDTSNLMCSRQGHLKQTHFDELKKNYAR